MQPLRIQVVFQGGGARVFGHFAAGEVLEEFTRNNDDLRIEITSVAGSSAGALAAAALTTPNTSVAEITKRFVNEARRVKVSFSGGLRSWLKLPFRLVRVLWGGAFFGGIDLRAIFRAVYRPTNGRSAHLVVANLSPATLIYYSNTSLGSMVPAPNTDEVAEALEKSCNFPFAFSGWRKNAEFVDGGLGQNLPVDDLYVDQDTKGELLAFAFNEEVFSKSRIPVIGQIQRLFATSIRISVERSKRLLGDENVIHITTNVGTFDFIGAINAFESDEYEKIKSDIREKLKSWIEYRQSIRGAWVKPNNTNSRMPHALTTHLEREASVSPVLHAKKAISSDVAILKDGIPSGHYRTVLRYEARVLRPTQLIRWRQSVSGKRTVGEVQLRGSAQDRQGNSLSFSFHVNCDFDSKKNMTRFDLYFCFPRDLSEGEEVVFQYELVTPDPYVNAYKDIDYSALRSVHGVIDEAIILVAFPKSLLPEKPQIVDIFAASQKLRDDAGFPANRDLIATEETDAGPLLLPYATILSGERFQIVSRIARNVEYQKALGFIIDSRGR